MKIPDGGEKQGHKDMVECATLVVEVEWYGGGDNFCLVAVRIKVKAVDYGRIRQK